VRDALAASFRHAAPSAPCPHDPSGAVDAEALPTLAPPRGRHEIVRGRLVVREPASLSHGTVAARRLAELALHLRSHPLSGLVAAGTGFTVARYPDTVRAPDVGFISRTRLPDPLPPRGFGAGAPDLASEVRSPDDRVGELLAKVGDRLGAGAKPAWVVDPVRRVAPVYRTDGTVDVLPSGGALGGEDVLPGCVVPLVRICG
jgi:Uma2 family endonuclease